MHVLWSRPGDSAPHSAQQFRNNHGPVRSDMYFRFHSFGIPFRRFPGNVCGFPVCPVLPVHNCRTVSLWLRFPVCTFLWRSWQMRHSVNCSRNHWYAGSPAGLPCTVWLPLHGCKGLMSHFGSLSDAPLYPEIFWVPAWYSLKFSSWSLLLCTLFRYVLHRHLIHYLHVPGQEQLHIFVLFRSSVHRIPYCFR